MAKSLGWYLPEQLILRITLADSDPKIWRRVEVDSGLSLDDLHYVIQSVFDWDNNHLYQFHVTPDGKLTQRAMSEATRFSVSPDGGFLGSDDDSDRRADEVMIGRVFTPTCKQIVYEYDFGDSWYHIVKLEKRTRPGDPTHIPQCLAGENAAPFDDMGGMGGYYMWLDALQNPGTEMHEEAVDWLGKKFDPTHFDLAKANRRLRAAFKPIPKRPRKPGKKAK